MSFFPPLDLASIVSAQNSRIVFFFFRGLCPVSQLVCLCWGENGGAGEVWVPYISDGPVYPFVPQTFG